MLCDKMEIDGCVDDHGETGKHNVAVLVDDSFHICSRSPSGFVIAKGSFLVQESVGVCRDKGKQNISDDVDCAPEKLGVHKSLVSPEKTFADVAGGLGT